MKKIIPFGLALAMSMSLYAQSGNDLLPAREAIRQLQSQNENFQSVDLFHSPENRNVPGIGPYVHLVLDEQALQNAFKDHYSSVKLELPMPNGTEVSFLLTQHKILTDDFMLSLTDGAGQHGRSYKPGLYYYGIIEGDESSIVALSFFDGHLGGVISNASGNWNLGPLEDQSARMTDEYAYFNDRSFALPLGFTCSTGDEPGSTGNTIIHGQRTIVGNCVRMFYDCDNDFYLYKSSNSTAVADYVTTLFNVESTMYANEMINVSISGINVWTVADPFNLGSSNANMNAFSDYWKTNFNGNLAQLLARDAGGLGGIAWLGVLCYGYSATYHTGPISYCDISASYAAGSLMFPTYTWDTDVITHESGHNFGSHHTHWCGWTGGPIDNCNLCWTNIPFEGGCTTGPNPPTSGGTIMSYCHGCSTGINLAAGFGLQPGNVIRNGVASANCLSSCSVSTCSPVVIVNTPVLNGTTVQFSATDTVRGNSSVQSGANVSFAGGDAVVLTLGFNAATGSVFTGKIAACTGTASSPAPPGQDTTGSLVSGSEEIKKDTDNGLSLSAYPNPFKDEVTIAFNLPKSERIKVEILNIEGQQLAVLFDDYANADQDYHVSFQSGSLQNGMYFYRLITESGLIKNNKLLLIR